MSKYEKWLQLSSELKLIKEREMRLRREIAFDIAGGDFSGETKMNKEEDGFSATVSFTLSRSLDEDVLSTVRAHLTEQERNCVKFKPSLIMKEYKEIGANSILHEAVTTKPSAPTLKVVPLR